MPHLYSAAALSEEGRADGSARREDPDANSMSSSLTKKWKYAQLLGGLVDNQRLTKHRSFRGKYPTQHMCSR